MPPPPNRTIVFGLDAATRSLGSLLLALGYAMTVAPTPTLIVSAVIVLWVLCANRVHDRQLDALRRARPGQTICHFARDFDRRGLDAWVVHATWDALQPYVSRAGIPFPLRAEDALEETLLIDGDELDYLVKDIARRAGRSFDHTEVNPYYGSVHTAGSLVRFLQAKPHAK